MERTYHLIKTLNIIWFLFFFTCSKPDAIKIQPAQDLSGTWRWISTYLDLPLSDTNPMTPQNSGIEEIIVFKKDLTWYKALNSLTTDSGTYSIGHGSVLRGGAFLFIYDSIAYFRNGYLVDSFPNFDYYKICGDSLDFNPYYGARFASYMLPHNGRKIWVRQ